MTKWFVHIAFLLIFMPCLSSARISGSSHSHTIYHYLHLSFPDSSEHFLADTTKTKQQKLQEAEDKKRIKEVAKAKRLPKPEKVEDEDNTNAEKKAKPKRQRRPPGMERPPEIPRRNGS